MPAHRGGLRLVHSSTVAREAGPASPLDASGPGAGDPSVTLARFVSQWLPHVRVNLRPSTWESYRCNLTHHVLPRLGTMPLKHISPGMLDGLYVELLVSGRVDGTGGLAQKTVHYVHTIVHRALRDALRWGLIDRNPAELCEPPRQCRPEVAAWSKAEVQRFLAAVRTDPRFAFYVLAITTGMRRGELLGLCWDSVDLEARRISVRRALIAVNYELHICAPKTRRSCRAVAIDATTATTLEVQRARRTEECAARGEALSGSDLVFANLDGSPIHPHSASQGFARHVRRLGLPRIRFHDLRHTSASLALAAGIHPKVVSERLGHASVTITLDTYSHVVPSLQEEAATKIAELIF